MLIKTLSSFASILPADERASVTLTVPTLYPPYRDVQLRIPQMLSAIETDARAIVGRRIARGRVELSLSLQLRHVPAVEVEFNEAFGDALLAAVEQARARGLVAGAMTPGDLLR